MNSHIIPEWAYKALYDEQHKYFELTPKFDGQVKFKYSGEYEHLLCKNCEQYFGKLDDYARAVIFSKPGEKTFGLRTTGGDGYVTIENVDYKPLKLFQISILWRASVSKRAFFNKVDLGPHECKIRQMLLTKNPGNPDLYGCIMIAFLKQPREPLLELILQPESFRANNHRWYKFLFAGCGWMYVVSSHEKRFKHKDLFVQRNGKLVILLSAVKDVKWITKNLPTIKKSPPSR